MEFSVKQWVELFEDIGLDEATMRSWHQTFERKYPDAHQSFLEWLGLGEERIAEIRRKHS